MNNITFGANNAFTWGVHGNSTGNPTAMNIPFVIEKTTSGERSYDLGSRLLQDRIINMDCGFDDNSAHVIKMSMLYLDSIDRSDIIWEINSGGGSVHAGMSIHDTADSCESDIVTISSGISASMGAYSVCCIGAEGKRLARPRSSLMLHMVSSGQQGQCLDMEAGFKHTMHLNKVLMQGIADRCGVSYDQLMNDCQRDFWLTATEARDYGKYGVVDGVLTGKRNDKGQLEVEYRGGKLGWIGKQN